MTPRDEAPLLRLGEASSAYFASGLVQAALDFFAAALKAITVDEVVEQATVRFGEVVRREVERQARKNASALVHKVAHDLVGLGHQIAEEGSDWYAGEGGTTRLDGLFDDSGHAVWQLRELGLAGWQTYMVAASLRLPVLRARELIPGREEESAILHEVEVFADHHWRMCEELRDDVLSHIGPCEWGFAPAEVDAFDILDRGPCYYCRLHTAQLLGLFREMGFPDEDYIATGLPRALDLHPDFGELSLDSRKELIGDDEYWLHNIVKAFRVIREPNEGATSSKNRIIDRQSEVVYRTWLPIRRAIIDPLHEMLVSWWDGLDEGRVREVAIRADNGKYVASELDKRGQLSASRDWIREWETFRLIRRADDKVALCAANHLFVAAELPDAWRDVPRFGELVANRDWIRSWETFRLLDLRGGKVALQATNDRYVTLGSNGALLATSPEIGTDERFELVPI